MSICEIFTTLSFIEKLPPSYADFKNYLKHKKKKMGLEELIMGFRWNLETELLTRLLLRSTVSTWLSTKAKERHTPILLPSLQKLLQP